MGLLITDAITLDSGLQVSNTYVNIGTETIHVTKINGKTAHDPPALYQYVAETKFKLWVNQEKANEGSTGSILKTYNVLVNKEGSGPFDENIHTLLYTQFKNAYGLTCEDVIE
jgi:hypothetical protein